LIPGISFKASSAHLEHTLTRDDVIRDHGFVRLLDRIHALIGSELCEQVFAKLDAAIAKLDPSRPMSVEERAWIEYLWAAARYHDQAKHSLSSASEAAALFRSPSGASLSRESLRKPKQRVAIIAARPNPITVALERSGAAVVWVPDECGEGRRLLELIAPAVVEAAQWCTALAPRDLEEAERWEVLATH